MVKCEEQPLCPVCQAGHVSLLLEIVQVPVHCNVLSSSRQAAKDVARDNITLQLCSSCGHAFNSTYDSERLNYMDEYQNPLHFSARYREYEDELINRVLNTYDLYDKEIIEIGSGDGHFLDLICARGSNRGIGFDPGCTADTGRDDHARTRFIKEPFSADTPGHKADAVFCRQVLEHIAQPRDFLALVRNSLKDRPGAVAIFEVPNLDFIVKDLSIWDLIYEHCSYYTRRSLRRLFESTGFRVCSLTETFGGQCLCIEAKPVDSGEGQGVGIQSDAELQAYDTGHFADQYKAGISNWQQRLRQMDQDGKVAAVWGAGSKGVMFLNMPVARDRIKYALDINPHKHGKYIPGSGQQIMPPTWLKTNMVDAVIVMNPIYAEEIGGILDHLGVQIELLQI